MQPTPDACHANDRPRPPPGWWQSLFLERPRAPGQTARALTHVDLFVLSRECFYAALNASPESATLVAESAHIHYRQEYSRLIVKSIAELGHMRGRTWKPSPNLAEKLKAWITRRRHERSLSPPPLTRKTETAHAAQAAPAAPAAPAAQAVQAAQATTMAGVPVDVGSSRAVGEVIMDRLSAVEASVGDLSKTVGCFSDKLDKLIQRPSPIEADQHRHTMAPRSPRQGLPPLSAHHVLTPPWPSGRCSNDWRAGLTRSILARDFR